MQELTLRLPRPEVEAALDAILLALPGGLHLREAGDAEIDLKVLLTPGTPAEEELRALAGPALLDSSVEEVSDDWERRRIERYEPLVIGGRFLVRPAWAPAAQGPDLVEIVIEQSGAFGTGLHPTTQACLGLLSELDPGGPTADYGCGSGVLSLAAAMLGFGPVVAIDVNEPTVASARRNAELNGVDLDVRLLDVTAETPPGARTIFANVPPEVHGGLTSRLETAPGQAVVSGFHEDEMGEVAAAWSKLGLEIADDVRASEWIALLLR